MVCGIRHHICLPPTPFVVTYYRCIRRGVLLRGRPNWPVLGVLEFLQTKNTQEVHCTSTLIEEIYIAGACSVGKRQPVMSASGYLTPSTSHKDTPAPEGLRAGTSSLHN